jgi:hypothetical protein
MTLNSFCLDGRFDSIVSELMLNIVLNKVLVYLVSYIETLTMKLVDFEEFLWEKGFNTEEMLLVAIHTKLNELFLHYVVVGKMLEVLKRYLNILILN